MEIRVTDSIIVHAEPPIISAQPAGTSYTAGDTSRALTVTASSIDGGTLSYQWFRNTVNSITEGAPTAVGGNSRTFSPSTMDSLGTFYYFVVVTNTNTRANGTKTQTATSDTAAITVSGKPLSGTVSISGYAVTGQTLTALYNLNGIGAIAYKWTHGDSGTALGTSETYKVSAADVGKTIKVTVTRALCTGVISAATAVVVKSVTVSGNTITAHSVASYAEVKAALTACLAGAPNSNSAADPVVVKINVTASSQLASGTDSIGVLFEANTVGRYVSYDLSDNNHLTTISGSGSRKNADKLVSVTLPNTLTSIGSTAFYGCSSLEAVSIPSSVKSIGNRAFSGCSSLEPVSIPSSVTTIGDWAFWGCSSLRSVDIPNSVAIIDAAAFHDCSSLESVTISNGVDSIGNDAFYNCSSLKSITVDSGNPNYMSDDGVLFDKAGTLMQYPAGKTGAYIIPSGVTSIGSFAFEGCSSLTSVTIPSSVTSIGNGAFYGCSSLTSVTIPSSVESIGDLAFTDCTNLTSVTMRSSRPPTLGDFVFSGGTPEGFEIKVPAALVPAYTTNNTVPEWSAEYKLLVRAE